MKIKAVIHKADEGGYWAEVPAIPACVSQGETLAELKRNLREAIAGCLAVDVAKIQKQPHDRVLTLAA